MQLHPTSAFFFLFLLGQIFPTQAQTLRGRVFNTQTNAPINAAELRLNGRNGEQQSNSDADGIYRFEQLKAGYYQLTISAKEFENQTLAEIIIASGKESVLDIGLSPTANLLPTFTVVASAPGRRAMQPLAEIPLTRDQTLRLPAMFFDPARLAAAYPGALQVDDGSNHLSVRGSNPAWVRWRLEGLDIVNPNHLPNAGTFSDLPAAAGGGVLMFSAQMLDQSSLLTGNYPAEHGDAVSGVMDMRLRAGNNQRHEFTAQTSLVGLDVAAEGPFSKKPNAASYLANYRYSTVGLLGRMGVTFGNEAINFQDFSFKLNFPGKNGGGWSVFGLGGYSENIFRHQPDTADIDLQKQRFDIDFNTITLISGANGLIKMGEKTWLKAAFVGSGYASERESVLQTKLLPGESLSDQNFLKELKGSASVSLLHAVNQQLKWSFGMAASGLIYEWERDLTAFSSTIYNTRTADYWGMNNWAWGRMDWKSRNGKTLAQLGGNIHRIVRQENNMSPAWSSASAANPNLSLTRILDEKNRISLSVGDHSQAQSYGIYENVEVFGVNTNAGLLLNRSRQLGLRYAHQLREAMVLRAECYSHHYRNVASLQPPSAHPAVSQFNINENFGFEDIPYLNNGAARVQGLELSAERFMRDGWFAAFNLTLSDSKYRANDGKWRNSRWDVGHLLNLSGGREWQRDDQKQKTFGLNGRIFWSGGLRYMPVDAVASAANTLQSTIYDASNGFSRQLPDYWRADFRVYWKRSLGDRRNSMFAMDLQNVTIRPNIAYYYWEAWTREVKAKNQLGLLPNLIWRIEF